MLQEALWGELGPQEFNSPADMSSWGVHGAIQPRGPPGRKEERLFIFSTVLWPIASEVEIVCSSAAISSLFPMQHIDCISWLQTASSCPVPFAARGISTSNRSCPPAVPSSPLFPGTRGSSSSGLPAMPLSQLMPRALNGRGPPPEIHACHAYGPRGGAVPGEDGEIAVDPQQR